MSISYIKIKQLNILTKRIGYKKSLYSIDLNDVWCETEELRNFIENKYSYYVEIKAEPNNNFLDFRFIIHNKEKKQVFIANETYDTYDDILNEGMLDKIITLCQFIVNEINGESNLLENSKTNYLIDDSIRRIDKK